MDITVEVQGLKGVEDALAQAGPKLAKRALRKALKAGGDLMVASAKSRAPLLKVATKRRQPGELRDSIGMKRLINDWFTGRLPFEKNFDPTRELPFGVTTMLSQGTLKHVG